MAKKNTALYFTTVCGYPNYTAVLGGHLVVQGDEPQGTRLMVFSGGTWTHLADMMDIVYATVVRQPRGEKRRLCALGRDGLYREFLSGERGENALEIPLQKTEVGYLEDLRVIGESVYACGAQGQVYRLRGRTWQAIDRGLRLKFNGEAVQRMLLSITGFSEDDIYVSGFEGEVWHFDGKRWSELDSPTNLPLNCALGAPDRRVYFCGEAGTLLALEPDGSWLDLSEKKFKEASFYDMTFFRDRLHIAADQQLLYLDRDRIRAVREPSEGEWRCLKIDAAEDRIWSVGSEEVFDYDGRKWTRHICPENE